MEIAVVKKHNVLFPAFESDKENFKFIKENEIYSFKLKINRNIKFHRKFFALIKLAHHNLPENLCGLYKNINHFRKAIMIEAGECEIYYTLDGVEIVEPISISFENMDEVTFNRVYHNVFNVIKNKIFDESFNEKIIETLEKDFE